MVASLVGPVLQEMAVGSLKSVHRNGENVDHSSLVYGNDTFVLQSCDRPLAKREICLSGPWVLILVQSGQCPGVKRMAQSKFNL